MYTLESITTPNGDFKVRDRVWIVDKFGTRAGTVDTVAQWLCNKGQENEEFTPFIRVRYDEEFNPFQSKTLGKWEDHFWRPAELDSVFPQPFISACCEASIIQHDERGHGKCSKCKENTTPIEPDPTNL